MSKRILHKSWAGWYHSATVGSAGDIVYMNEREATSEDINWFGPFATFGEAKDDAIIYHRVDIDNARNAIRDIRKIRKPRKLK